MRAAAARWLSRQGEGRMKNCGSRREFLRVLGALSSYELLGMPAALADGPRRLFVREDRFGRMFPDLPPFAAPSAALTAALLEIGKAGGILDAKDDLAAGPVALIVDPALSQNNANSSRHTAGTTFMGQFMDHDITFDLSSVLGTPVDPEDSPNSRTPTFDLDSVYGGGPGRSPQLYERQGGSKFKIASGGVFEDLPRSSAGRAIIPDPRNDENVVIAGLHAAFLCFHNRAVDYLASRRPASSAAETFMAARQLVTWHYHWIIVHETLPLFVGEPLVEEILRYGPKFYRPRAATFIPVEFQGAAYRFGHSMVRPSYRVNLAGDNGQPFFGLIFDPAGEGQADPVDLRGGASAPRRFIGWQTFFDFGSIPRPSGIGTLGLDMRPNKLIDTKISTPLFNLPLAAIASGDLPTSLPQRNLLRHVTWQLPSGQSIAQVMEEEPLSAADLAELAVYGIGLEHSTPLWYYILKEAELREAGSILGPVGGRIVAEVILSLLQHDLRSYLSVNPMWQPTLPSITGAVTGDFRMIDLLAFAGVDPTSRGQ